MHHYVSRPKIPMAFTFGCSDLIRVTNRHHNQVEMVLLVARTVDVRNLSLSLRFVFPRSFF